MSLPTDNNPYSFEQFLETRNQIDYYADDAFIQKVLKHFAGDAFETINQSVRQMSAKASTKWRKWAEEAAYPEKAPYVIHYDGMNRRVDRLVRPMETLEMEKEVYAEGIFSDKVSRWERMTKLFIISQNGEACTLCPMVCTEGLVEVLKKFPNPQYQHILDHAKEGNEEGFAIGSQYISEIQGGSDVPANMLQAQKDGDHWRLYGTKYYASATHADYTIITAKPEGSDKVGLFVTPTYLPGDQEKEQRNGVIINRIKYKMGTRELTSAELVYDGAVAYQVGELDRGLQNVVGTVLTYSRMSIGVGSAGFMARAAREARLYSRFRKAFGQPIGDFPMLAGQVESIEHRYQRTVAGLYKLYNEFINLPVGTEVSLSYENETAEAKKHRFNVRELIMFQKITTAIDSTHTLKDTIYIFGAYGVMEDFSSIPRLFRDSLVNELWEGPRNVLLTQIHRDFQRVASWHKPSDFVKSVLNGYDPEETNHLAEQMDELVAYPDLNEMSETTKAVCQRWDKFAEDFYHAYQELALQEVMQSG